MYHPSHPRTRALLQALLVTFLWSTSWVLIKRTLTEIPPLLFAGLRYTLAAIVLLPGLIRRRAEVRELNRADWLRLIVLGLVLYTLTQGGQFVTLQHLEAVTFSLVLNFTSVLAALAGILTLHELPGRLQWLGIALFGAGAISYFWGGAALTGRGLGLVLACLTMGANAGASLLGRWVNRGQRLTPARHHRHQHGRRRNRDARTGACDRRVAQYQPPELGRHPLARRRQLCTRLHAMESLTGGPVGRRVERHQQHHAHPDRHPRVGVSGRATGAAADWGACGRHRRGGVSAGAEGTN